MFTIDAGTPRSGTWKPVLLHPSSVYRWQQKQIFLFLAHVRSMHRNISVRYVIIKTDHSLGEPNWENNFNESRCYSVQYYRNYICTTWHCTRSLSGELWTDYVIIWRIFPFCLVRLNRAIWFRISSFHGSLNTVYHIEQRTPYGGIGPPKGLLSTQDNTDVHSGVERYSNPQWQR
jgi:hypothetical protein